MSMLIARDNRKQVLKGGDIDNARTRIASAFGQGTHVVTRKQGWLRFTNTGTRVALIVSPDDAHYESLNILAQRAHQSDLIRQHVRKEQTQ